MRADIHGGQERKTLQSEAGYIDARPPTARPKKLLATHGRTIHSGQLRHLAVGLGVAASPSNSEIARRFANYAERRQPPLPKSLRFGSRSTDIRSECTASLRPFGSPGTQSANSNSAMSLSRPPQVVLEFESKVASVELSCLSAPMSKSLSRRRRLARADCIAFVTRYCCWSGRRLRRPSEVVDYVLAFWVIRDLIATCAQPAGVLLCSASRAKTSAPAATSSFTISRSPFHAAECRAVPCDPHAAFALTWAPWESNQRTSSWWLSG